MDYNRKPMSRAEFDAACARLEQLRPDLSESSGARSVPRNESVGGDQQSKHVATTDRPAMARDYETDFDMAPDNITMLEQQAKTLGLWAVYHDAGSGDHLHVQGLPPG